GVGGERLPAESIGPVEAERFRQVVDPRLLLVGDILLFRHPEEIRRHQPRERGAILLAGDFAELLADRVEVPIVHPRAQREGRRLVRRERRCWRLSRRWRRWLRWAEGRQGREHARNHERSRDEMGGREAWMPHRGVSQGCKPCFSAGFSPLYGKKKGD